MLVLESASTTTQNQTQSLPIEAVGAQEAELIPQEQPVREEPLALIAPAIDADAIAAPDAASLGTDPDAVVSSDDAPEGTSKRASRKKMFAKKGKQRIWEIDFLRGLLMMFVTWDHFNCYLFITNASYRTPFFQALRDHALTYWNSPLRVSTQPHFVSLFVLLAGISCSFSRNNIKRALKMVLFSVAFSGVYAVLHFTIGLGILHFNVLHVVALSVLVWSGIDWIWSRCKTPIAKNIFGFSMALLTAAVFIIGACFNHAPSTDPIKAFFFLFRHDVSVPGFAEFIQMDYLPFLPSFGYFLLGAFMGRIVYREKKTLFPTVDGTKLRFLTFWGRHSLGLYLGFTAIGYGVLFLLGSVLQWI